MIPRELWDLRRSIAQLIELLGTPQRPWEVTSSGPNPQVVGTYLAVPGPCDLMLLGADSAVATNIYAYDLEAAPPVAALPTQAKASASLFGTGPIRFRRGLVLYVRVQDAWTLVYRRLTREEIEADQRTLDTGQ